MRSTPKNSAFTLIELLVVISIIALLIAILLPVLSRARRSAQLAQSMSNLRQISTANGAYMADNQDVPPIGIDTPTALSTWNFGGKFCDPYWGSAAGGGGHDIAPSARPLNEYLYPGRLHPPVTGTPLFGSDTPGRPAFNSSERVEELELPIFKDPRDTVSWQRARLFSFPEELSSYDDVGTSYHINYRWLTQYQWDNPGLSREGALQKGTQVFRSAAVGLSPSRFWMYSDELGDLTKWPTGTTGFFGALDLESDYGQPGHAPIGFLDAHVAFVPVVEGEASTDDYDATLP